MLSFDRPHVCALSALPLCLALTPSQCTSACQRVEKCWHVNIASNSSYQHARLAAVLARPVKWGKFIGGEEAAAYEIRLRGVTNNKTCALNMQEPTHRGGMIRATTRCYLQERGRIDMPRECRPTRWTQDGRRSRLADRRAAPHRLEGRNDGGTVHHRRTRTAHLRHGRAVLERMRRIEKHVREARGKPCACVSPKPLSRHPFQHWPCGLGPARARATACAVSGSRKRLRHCVQKTCCWGP